MVASHWICQYMSATTGLQKKVTNIPYLRGNFNISDGNGDTLLGPSPQVEVQHTFATYVILAFGSQLTMAGPFGHSHCEIPIE